MFLYRGLITPSSQELGITPELKIKLKKITYSYNGILLCAVVLIYLFIIPSLERAFNVYLFQVFNTFQYFIF